MKRIRFKFCYLILVIFGFLCVYLSFSSRKSLKLNDEARMELAFLEYRIEKYNTRLQMELFTENLTLNSVFLTDIKNDTVSLNSLISSPKLIYRFSGQSCNACVDDDIEYLRKLGDSIGYQNIILISDYENTRLLNIFRNKSQIGSPCYNFTGDFNLSIESESSMKKPTFFFILDGNLRIQFAYLSDEYPEFNDIYIQRITAYFRDGF